MGFNSAFKGLKTSILAHDHKPWRYVGV